MSLLSRRPREKDTQEIVFDARPPSGRDSAIAAHEALWGKSRPLAPPEEEAAERVIQYLRESEVMPSEPDRRTNNHDIRPPSATEANRLDQIEMLIRSLTYGEMMDLAAALWKMRPEGKEVTEQELPGMWHKWSAKNA